MLGNIYYCTRTGTYHTVVCRSNFVNASQNFQRSDNAKNPENGNPVGAKFEAASSSSPATEEQRPLELTLDASNRPNQSINQSYHRND